MPRKVRRRQVIRAVGAAGVVGLAGCTGDGDETTTAPAATPTSTPTPSGRTIQVGILMGVTGGLSDLGPPIRQSAELAANYLDDESDTYTIDFSFQDTATDPNTGIEAANTLVNAGYPAIAGALSSSVTIQVANQVTIPNGVVQCSPASTAPAITTLEDNDYVYRTTPTDALQSQVMVQVGMERLEASSSSILALNNDYGQGLADAYAENWEAGGGSIENRVNFEPGQSSYTSQLATALQNQPDLLMIVGYPDSGVNIFRDFYSEYSEDFCDIIVPDGLQSQDLPGDVGEPMRNVWGTAPSSIGPGRETFNSLYEDEYDSDPTASPFTAQSFDAVAVLALANAAAGENTGSAIRDEMNAVANSPGTNVTPTNLAEGLSMAADGTDINYQGASSAIAFDDAGDIAAATYQLYRYQEGGYENIDQIEFSA